MKTLRDLLVPLPDFTVKGTLDVEISGIFYDSRQVQPGGIFVCISGYRADGHAYIDQALAKGAKVVVVEKPVEMQQGVSYLTVRDTRRALAALACSYYDFPADELNLIGVTGTNGKTSTTYLTRAILKKHGEKVGLLGTIANLVGDEVIPAHHTTPESSDLQQLFRGMVQAKVTYAVMEVSSHALELQRVAGCEYDVAIFTNLTQDHLDFHPSLEAYLEAKAKLFKGLGPGNKKRCKYAVINYDDQYFQYLASRTRVPVISYGLKQGAAYRATDVEIRMDGISYTVQYPGGSFALNLKLGGKFSVYNSLAACAVGLEEGVPPELVKTALEEMQGIPGRFQLLNCGQDFAVVVDYAHTPDSLENVLHTARQVTPGRVIVVFGCGGDRDRTKRPIMGATAARLGDYCIVTSDNPRTENPRSIIADIEAGMTGSTAPYQVVEDRRKAIKTALAMAEPGDMVVIAGKGHENYQIIGEQVIPFDDAAVAKEILNG